MHHQRCEIDRRSVRVRLTERGREVHQVVAELLERQSAALENDTLVGGSSIKTMNKALQRVERFWSDQIRYIY